MARQDGTMAATAGAADEVPQSVRNLLTKARTAWLKNTEVLDLLSNYQRYNFTLNKTTPNLPPGTSLRLRSSIALGASHFLVYCRLVRRTELFCLSLSVKVRLCLIQASGQQHWTKRRVHLVRT